VQQAVNIFHVQTSTSKNLTKHAMRTIFTLMTFVIFCGVTNHLAAQTSHHVTVSNNSYNPSSLVINSGDTVIWTNVQGNHNVNGTTASFPNNPQSFGNSVGSGWTYSFVFTIPGNYDYKCDPHVFFGMNGSLVVNEVATGLQTQSASSMISSVYPVPANEFVVIELNPDRAKYMQLQIRLVDQLGRLMETKSVGATDRVEIDVRHLRSGMYFFQLIDGEQTLHTGRLIVQ